MTSRLVSGFEEDEWKYFPPGTERNFVKELAKDYYSNNLDKSEFYREANIETLQKLVVDRSRFISYLKRTFSFMSGHLLDQRRELIHVRRVVLEKENQKKILLALLVQFEEDS